MEGVIDSFHIDVKLIVARAVNFGIVLAVLYKFAYKPLLKHMNERSELIEKGIRDAEKAAKQLEQTNQDSEQKMIAAQVAAQKIVEEARVLAEKQKTELVERSKAEAAKIIKKAKETISQEKEKMMGEVKKQTIELVAAMTQKIMGDAIDLGTRKKITEQSQKMIEKELT